MRLLVKALTFPKSEHTAQTNEDALAYSAAAGLFAVADGVGSASFSGEWARLLVEQFVSEPLLSDDPFELEWWLRRAQRRYDGRVPAPDALPPFAREKARQGGAATLVALRLCAVAEESVTAECLAVGDSCAIVGRRDGDALESFPLSTAAEFSTATVALPARSRYFDRHLHRCHRLTLALAAGDVALLVTDAVAKAIVGAGGGRLGSARETFAAVAQADEAGWAALVGRWREDGALADDDATALVISWGGEGDEPGCTTAPEPGLVAERRAELAAALAEGRLEAVAACYGDGSYFADAPLEPLLVQRARLVAEAVAEVRAGIMRSLGPRRGSGTPLADVWQRWAPLLAEEPSAAALRASLQQLGLLTPPRWPHLLPFRDALARADAESVAALAPPDDLAHLLTEGEWRLVATARDWLARREDLRAGLDQGELRPVAGPVLPGGLAVALAGDDDERVLLAVGIDADDRATARAVLARERLQRLARLRLALASGDDAAVLLACPDGFEDYPLLRPSERRRVARARRLATATDGPAEPPPLADEGAG